jgi:hypothetical protein
VPSRVSCRPATSSSGWRKKTRARTPELLRTARAERDENGS